MELTATTQQVVSSHEVESTISNNNNFLEANTQQVSLSHLSYGVPTNMCKYV